ncbi:MAG: HAD family hydrolase [Treponemataceae bacterium]
MIKAVIFDYGNVISVTQTGACYQLMQEKTGVPKEIFSSSFFKYRESFDLGDISGSELYSKIFDDHGYAEFASDKKLCKQMADIDMQSWRNYNQEVVDWALELQSQGFKLGILSNMPYEFLDNFEKDIPPFVKADCAVFSCRVKMIKPSAGIYSHALEGLKVKPQEAIFFDDLHENIIAAQKLNIHSVLWTDITRAKEMALSIIEQQKDKHL